MATSTSLANVEKLTEVNYELWKIQMKSILVFNDLWQYVDGTEMKPAENAQEWLKKDAKALALINLSITHGQLNHVKKAVSSKEAWDGLKAVFESRGPVRKAALYKQLLRMEKKTNITMTQYVADYTRKAEQLEEAGIEIPDELLSIMLLGSLPSEFENFNVAIESRDEIPTLENLKIKLIEEEARQSDRMSKTSEDSNTNALLTKGRSKHAHAKSKDNFTKANAGKFVGKCFNCGKNGHMSRQCKAKPRNNESKDDSDAMTAIACNTEVIDRPEAWYLDSGATKHMCNEKRIFKTINNDNELKVHTAAEHFEKSYGSGDINLKVKLNRNATNSVKLKNALYVPGLRNNLLSVSSVTDNGYTVTFKKNRATINRKDGSVVLTATKRDQLYIVDEKKECTAFIDDKDQSDLRKWHQRYGHLNVTDLRAMQNKEMVKGLNFSSRANQINCEICAKCKIHVQPFKPSSNREKKILGLIHSDICGPINVESIGGAKYFISFIDDNSRYTEVTMLRNKSDAFQAFKDYKRRVEKQTGQRIKKLRTDNGREYLSNNFKDFLKEEGIQHQLSVEYTPQQNGVAERANRTLVEMARCIMSQANLPESLWAEAVNTATFLRNRCATKSLDGITPFEAWTQNKPYVGFFRTIGSKTIALNKSRKGKKFQPKGEQYILVGYSEESKAYRLWKQGTKTVIKARDVKFFERIGDPIESTSRKAFTVPDANETTNEERCKWQEDGIKNEIESDLHDERNCHNNEEGEDSSENEQVIEQEDNEPRRGPGRPKIIKTGKPGRPRKTYCLRDVQHSDPSSISEILEQDNKKD